MTLNTFLLLVNSGALMILVFAELYGIHLITSKRKKPRTYFHPDEIGANLNDFKLGYEPLKGDKVNAKRTQTKTTGSTKVTPKAQEIKASTTRKKDKPTVNKRSR